MAQQQQQHQLQSGPSNYQTISKPSHTSVFIGNDQSHHSLFNTKEIRSKFVSKVYSILLVQLVVASILIGVSTLHEPTKEYLKQNGSPWAYGALAVGLVSFLILTCVETARRSTPWNYILLALLTLSYGLMAAILSSRSDTYAVLSAFGATALATGLIFVLAKYSSVDVTSCGCGLCILSLLHLVLTLLLLVILVPLGYASVASTIISGLGALLVSVYLLFDLQIIMGGRSVELSPEEYILGAVLLYIDIIYLFQYMLLLLGRQ